MMDRDTMLLLRKSVDADEDDVIIVLHVKQKDVARVSAALELAGITKQETGIVSGE